MPRLPRFTGSPGVQTRPEERDGLSRSRSGVKAEVARMEKKIPGVAGSCGRTQAIDDPRVGDASILPQTNRALA